MSLHQHILTLIKHIHGCMNLHAGFLHSSLQLVGTYMVKNEFHLALGNFGETRHYIYSQISYTNKHTVFSPNI